MSKNYQITQNDYPLCSNGSVETEVNGKLKKFFIERIHQEENAAKNTHDGKASNVDYNRAGTALMEIVTEPCMHSADEALAYMTLIKQILQYGNISDCDQEKGQMRSDVNISVRPKGHEKLGAKVEIKNMNSFSFIVDAINYESQRQIDILSSEELLNNKHEAMIHQEEKHSYNVQKKTLMIIGIFLNLIYCLLILQTSKLIHGL